jgi:hypothetical protein
MIARVTLGELDLVRVGLDEAVDVVRRSVVPALRAQDGYDGMYLLVTEKGKALVVTLWTTEEAADAGVVRSRPIFEDEIEEFAAVHRSPPGREAYSVALSDAPGDTIA